MLAPPAGDTLTTDSAGSGYVMNQVNFYMHIHSGDTFQYVFDLPASSKMTLVGHPDVKFWSYDL